MPPQELFQSCDILLADFPEHPPNRFMDEVMLVSEENFCNAKGFVKSMVANTCQRCDYRHTL